MRHFLDFERPIAELEGKIEELRHLSTDSGLNIADEVGRLEASADRLLRQTYARLTPWQKVQVARHPERPHCRRLHRRADHRFHAARRRPRFRRGRRDRSAASAGSAAAASSCSAPRRAPTPRAGVKHNFGMARPEGYRKARRLMRLAERFGLPVLTFVDTAGAYPGIDAEARGQSRGDRRARSRPASTSRCRWSPRSSARAARAARSRSPPAIPC